MLWVSHGVSEQNSRRAAHTAQPGSLTPPAIRTPPPAGTRPCLALLVGQSRWGQLCTPLQLAPCCPAPRCCKGSGVPVARLTQACEKAHAKRGGGVSSRRDGAFWLRESRGCDVGPVSHCCGSREPLLLAVCNAAQPGTEMPDSWNYYAKHNMKMLRALLSRQHSQAKSSVD